MKKDNSVEKEELNAKVEALLARMTLPEKASLTSGASMWTTKSIDRLAVPSIMMTDGPHGVRKAIDGQFGESEPAICYPPAVTLASTWNVDLAEDVGVALGKESQAMNVQILLGPGTNIKRSPLGGRNFEYFSEDPVLSGIFSSAYINGVQSQGVGVSLKHFAVNDQEHERMTISAEVSDRALHEIYLRPFEIAVKCASPATIMSAYNKINGTYASNSEYLLNDILRKQWGFEGLVVTDWGAVDDRVQGIRARLHLQMPSDGGINDKKIVNAVNSGELNLSDLDDLVRSTLKATLTLDNCRLENYSYDHDKHHQLAYKIASEGIVLLKNQDNILPLADNDNVAVVGNFAKIPRYQGAGSSLITPTKIDNLIDNLEAGFAPGYDLMGNTNPELLEEAKQLARDADKVVVVVGLTFIEESEGFDRASYDISPGHQQLVEAVTEVNSNVIVVLQNGSPVAMPWLDHVKGVVESYLGGQAGGHALADVLTGKINPSGKLAETFPERIEDNPTYIGWAGEEGKTYYNEGVFVGYRYYDKKGLTPLFPFGFGLSYTQFEFSDIDVNYSEFSERDELTVRCKVKNTGSLGGHEVVQLYIKDEECSVGRPEKELKHFSKVYLEPGEEADVLFNLSYSDFTFYSSQHERWLAESGCFLIKVGNSSRNLPLQKNVSLLAEDIPKKVFTKYSLLKELKGNSVGEMVLEGIKTNITGTFQQIDVDKASSEEDEIQAMKKKIFIDSLMRDMPIKNIVQFSNGEVSEEDLDNILAAMNQ